MFRNKLLAFSFLASFALNATFLALVGNSGLFRRTGLPNNLRAVQIEIYKPPVAEKARPKPKLTPPPIKHNLPLAHPVIQPTNRPRLPQPVQPARTTVYQKPKPQPAQPVPHTAVFVRRQPPQPTNKPATHASAPPHTAVSLPATHPAVNLGSHSNQGSLAVPAAPTNPAPVTHSVATQQPVTPQAVETPTPAPVQPRPATVEDQPKSKSPPGDNGTPEVIGGWSDLELPDNYDPSTITRARIPAHWVVDKTGHARSIKFPSSGNSDVDNVIREYIENHHYEPAVQNGEPQDCALEHTFVIGQ
jgi:hypothetical protein